MKRLFAALLILFFSVTLLAQEQLVSTGKHGLKKRSWVLMETTMTVKGERSVEVPSSAYEGKVINYVAFYVKGKLIGLDEIPPFKVTHDFGNYTQKAKIIAIGVQYQIDESLVAAVATEKTGADNLATTENKPADTTTATQKAESSPDETDASEVTDPGSDIDPQGEMTIAAGSMALLSPSKEAYAYGVQVLKAQVNLPVEQVQRVDFTVDDRTVGSVPAPPYEVEYDFGRGFAAHRVKAIAILRDGSQLTDDVITRPLEGSDYFVRTRLVTLEATVIDWRDRLVGDLNQKEFQVWEDGKQQEVTHFAVEERPIRVAILLDASGSMSQRQKMQRAVESAKQFLDYLKPEQDRAALIVFTDVVNKLSGFTDDFAKLKKMLDQIRADGGTAINDTLDAVVPLFDDEIGRKAMVLITDGYDEHSRVNVGDAVEKVRRAGVKIFSVGIFDQDYYMQQTQRAMAEPKALRGKDPDVDPTDARKKNRAFEKGQDTRTVMFEGLADETGGAAFFPQNLAELPIVFARIANELRNMYSIGYIPTNNVTDGKWRSVTVKATRGGLTVRTRRGYYAEK